MAGFPTSLAPDTPLTLVTLGTTALRVAVARDAAVSGATGISPADGAPDDGTVFDLGKPLALITYLACAPDRSAHREHLIDLLWGGVEPDAGKHALRQTLWYVRKRLGERHLIVGGDVLSIAGPLDCDRDALLAAAERGDPEAVVRTFTGDFFPGFAAPGGAEFERWADNERQRLRSHFCRATETVVRRWMSALKLRDAQMLARRARDLDPLREAGWRLLFETLVAAGDTVGSALEADAFDRLVAVEGISPEPATRAMLRAVRQAPPGDERLQTDDRPSLATELVGREQEFAQLLACWESARVGQSTHVHVLAPAGVGKTRLLTDVDARLRATRARTLFVRASLGGRDIPFGLAGDLAEGLARLPGASGISTGSARALVALNPALSVSYPAALPDAGGDQSDALRRRTVAVRELIAAVAEEHPIAVFVDDMQWADTRSRQLIAGVVGALERVRVLMVTASRPGVDAFPSSDHSRTIRLEPLTTADVSALVASIAELPSEPWSEHLAPELCDATGGSPLLVLETLQMLVEGNMLAHDGHAWSSRDPARVFAALGAGGALRQRVERLDRVERWVLTLLAVAAVPLSRETLTAAGGRPADETVTALGILERRGLAARHGDAWVPSHDEIAAMVVELATRDARRAASRAIGRALLENAGEDARALRHAGGLLVQAEELDRVSVAFTRFAHLARDVGDHRPNRVLADDFLGERATPALVDRLVRSVPLLHRMGLYSARRQVVATAVLVTASLGMLVSNHVRRTPPPDIVLAIGTVGGDSVARVHRVPVRWAQVTPGQTVRVGEGRPRWRLHADPSLGELRRLPGNTGWTLERVFEDSGGIDLVEIDDGGHEQRLTAAAGDDQSGASSPDGRYVAFVTARWNAASHYDLGILDRHTGGVRALTQGPETDLAPVWSPDGSRIAFTRRYWTVQKQEICVIDVDGTNARCFGTPASDLSTPGGWYDANRVVVHIVGAERRSLGRLDARTGAIDTLVSLRTNDTPIVSLDGRWVLCRCQRNGFAATAALLFPLDEPNRAVEVDMDLLPVGRPLLAFEPTPRSAQYAERIAIESGPGTPTLGASHLLSAVGVSPSRALVPTASVRWMSLDTAVATIDSTGLLTPKSLGAVRVQASIGGWRTAQREFSIGVPSIRTLASETWADGIVAPWVAFGDPLPVVDTLPDGSHALRNNGDGSFSSGVYTSDQYPVRDGLTLDTWVSVTVTKDQWQIVHLSFEDQLDDDDLRRWKHRYGNIPRRRNDDSPCTIAYPGAEGVSYGDSLIVSAPSLIMRGLAVPASFKRGKWFNVRMQIFPDGRCGIAVNGVPLAVTIERAIRDSSVRIMTFGNSAETKALVGPMTLRTGVGDDIDWSRLGDAVPDAPPSVNPVPVPRSVLSQSPPR